MTILEQWGHPLPSIVSVEEDGHCLNFIYENTVVPSPHSTFGWDYEYQGHIVRLLEASGDLPDKLEVIPEVGWQAITQNPSVAPDWATTIITICQQLLG